MMVSSAQDQFTVTPEGLTLVPTAMRESAAGQDTQKADLPARGGPGSA
jgi:hypothetical protein